MGARISLGALAVLAIAGLLVARRPRVSRADEPVGPRDPSA
jgi:hypothetical protein